MTLSQVPEPKLIVWHDGACPLCTREIATMRWLDRGGRIRFIDVSDDTTTCPVDRRAMLARFHAMEDGVLLSGGAAFAAMWRAIPLLRPLGLAAKITIVARALDIVYEQFLKFRPGLQRALRSVSL